MNCFSEIFPCSVCVCVLCACLQEFEFVGREKSKIFITSSDMLQWQTGLNDKILQQINVQNVLLEISAQQHKWSVSGSIEAGIK